MYIYLGCQMNFAFLSNINEMKWNEIKYEMQMSCIELKSIESAFVKGDNVEKISKRNHM